eukprot:TRINITY_DN6812_c0_g1_i1.p1 TRINITY_DN6812_c0_g1~~TRINITY_DN6812_c0_g1_i1.p1  ORF type:complete len:258 (+),score=15.10 TRINITY_DN6812_c0_g1_i1:68-841(+)
MFAKRCLFGKIKLPHYVPASAGFSNSSNYSPINLLLVRHAESIGNCDKSLMKHMADHVIPLSDEGHNQAQLAGKVIREYLEKNTSPTTHRRMWVSPYRRTRETADHICNIAGEWITDCKEHILIGEQQFGLFEGRDGEEISALYPQEYGHFSKCIEGEGRFWARPPLGESRFDVAKRIHQAFGTFHRDAQMHGIHDLIVVSHGVALRALAMMWLHHPVEWFEKEPNPQFCSVRLLEGNTDKGYIFNGFKAEEKFVHY